MNRHSSALTRIAAAAYFAWLAGAAPAFGQTVPECGGLLPPSTKLPDLVNIIPHHVHAQEQRKRHRLMFTSGFGNIGDGPMELAPAASLTDPNVLVTANQNLYDGPTNSTGALLCKRSLQNAFLYHPEHNHWHLTGINGFEVRAALDDGSGGRWAGGTAVGSMKESFCLLDYIKMADEQLAGYGITLPPREYFDCAGVHGVSVGWIDYYHHATHGQYVDITGAPEGIYYLVVTANPDKLFLESNYENNRVWVSFRLEYNNSNNAIVSVLYDSLERFGQGLVTPSKTNR